MMALKNVIAAALFGIGCLGQLAALLSLNNWFDLPPLLATMLTVGIFFASTAIGAAGYRRFPQ
jgi:hypothetical protein